MAEETSQTPSASGSKDVEENKAIAAIGYIGILFLIPLLAKKDSPYAQYHAKQGLVLFVADVILGFVGWIPFIGWAVLGIGGLLVFILFIIGLMNALGGKMQPLPVIGSYGEKIKI